MVEFIEQKKLRPDGQPKGGVFPTAHVTCSASKNSERIYISPFHDIGQI